MLKSPPKSVRYSWKKALLLIVLSTFLISGGTGLALFLYKSVKNVQAREGGSKIEILVQTGPLHAPLSSVYLAEVLDLSADNSALMGQFDLAEGEERLLATHVICSAKLKKVNPNILLVDYSLRQPIGFIEDYTNTLVDREGFIFPYLPFYSPRKLPKIYLGASAPPGQWGERVNPKCWKVVTTLLSTLPPGEIQRIDLSHFESPSRGKKEVVILFETGTLVRFSPYGLEEQLRRWQILKSNLLQDTQIPYMIDMRIAQTAYLRQV